jgi:hypothetical protein
MTTQAVELLEQEADKRSLRECKECSLLRIEDGKPTCMFSNENLKEDCQILELK